MYECIVVVAFPVIVKIQKIQKIYKKKLLKSTCCWLVFAMRINSYREKKGTKKKQAQNQKTSNKGDDYETRQ